jgi:hypothetical protein
MRMGSRPAPPHPARSSATCATSVVPAAKRVSDRPEAPCPPTAGLGRRGSQWRPARRHQSRRRARRGAAYTGRRAPVIRASLTEPTNNRFRCTAQPAAATARATSRSRDVSSYRAGDARNSESQARSPARSLRPSGRPLAPGLVRHGCGRHADRVAVTPASPGIVGSVQPTALSDPATGKRVVRVGRPEGCRPKLEKLAASLWMLVQEPDVDPARVPEATGAPIRRHRRRDRNRLDGVGDQPSPSR